MSEPGHANTDDFWNGDAWKLLLIGLSLVMTFQMIRVFATTLTFAYGERYGQLLAARPALIVFAFPILTPLVATALGPRRFLVFTIGSLAVLRSLLQIQRDVIINLYIEGAAIILALMALVLLFSLPSSTTTASLRRFGPAVFLGMTLDTGLHGAFLTWDYAWQPGLLPLLTSLVISGLTVLAAWRVQAKLPERWPGEPRLRNVFPPAALGAFFTLQMVFFQNTAFVASSGLIHLEPALTVVLCGNAIGLITFSLIDRQAAWVRLLSGAVLILAVILAQSVTGPMLIAAVLLGQAAAAGMLGWMLSSLPGPRAGAGLRRTSLAVAGGSLLFIVPAILYYMSSLMTLPFPPAFLMPASAIVLALAGLFASPRPGVEAVPRYTDRMLERPSEVQAVADHARRKLERRWAALPLILLLIPLALQLTRPAPIQAAPTGDTLRLLDYNIHQSVTFDGWLDPEGLARVIEAQNADVITLQEISRGTLISGTLDNAEWLSRRLNMPYVYAPGHDYQFGNLLFTRLPIQDWSFLRLPLQQNVPMGRGLIQAKILLGDGKTLTVINTHLSAYAQDSDRIPQVRKVLETWGGIPHTIIAGDTNAYPQDGATALFLDAGLTSAQDSTGHGNLFTWTSAEPAYRIDWIFGTDDIEFSDFVIQSTQASDHLPLAVTIQMR